MKKQIPKYYGFRVYFSSNLLYSFLIIPFLFFIIAQNIPETLKNRTFLNKDAKVVADSLVHTAESIPNFQSEDIDSLVNNAIAMSESFADSVVMKNGPEINWSFNKDNDEDDLFNSNGPFELFFKLLFLLTLVSYMVGLIYNRPFKKYFKRLRRKKEIPDKLRAKCKKLLLNSALVNAAIVTLPSALIIGYFFFFVILGKGIEGDLEHEVFREFFYLAILATLLEFLFVYYWQKHRVNIRYIEHVFSGEELRQSVYRRKGGKIRSRLLMASGLTTFLPLLIVMVYLVQSLTKIKNLGLDGMSQEALEILVGPWAMFIKDEESSLLKILDSTVYVNAVDSLSMIIGISTGIIVSLIYLYLFIKWTNQDITRPVKELLVHMKNTRGGEVEQYAIVRTNDEIGELAEGYNEMTKKIHDHMEHIFTMNRDLEKTVEERTEEVVMQKEEIEAQKEEIEAQLDMATQQRDTITVQKEQILDSIRYAEKIQSALLPPAKYLEEALSDHFILFKPRDIVSGDYYWTSFKDGKILIAVADCTGHGVPGAFLSVLGISSMSEIVNREGTPRASQVLEHLRNFVIHTLHQTGTRGEAQDGIEIALCIIDPVKKSIEFAGANRPLYLVRSAGKTKKDSKPELIQIKGDRMPIGIYEQDPAPFTDHIHTLKKGDTIYMFSDGYVDQLGGKKRKTFRSIHFREILMQIQDKSMKEQRDILLKTHESWRGEVEQIDDILVIGVRI